MRIHKHSPITPHYRIEFENVSLDYYLYERDLKSSLVKLVKRKPLFEKSQIIRNVSFKVAPSEVVCLIGTNGVGKSSLLYAITGKLPISKGKIVVDGKINAVLGMFGRISPFETGFAALKTWAGFLGSNKDLINKNLDLVSKLSGIPVEIIVNRPFHSYSTGMISRLQATIGLLLDTDIQLYDETLFTGDKQFNGFFMNRVGKSRDNGACYIIVSHNPLVWELVAKHNGRFIVLGDNTLLYDGFNIDTAQREYDGSEKYRVEIPTN